MRDIDRALSDIALMREQLARNCEFRGFGPKSVAITGLLAFVVASTQGLWLRQPAEHPAAFICAWCAVAAASVLLIGIEAMARSKLAHGSMALSMVQSAAEHFCPAIVAGALLTVGILQRAPQCAWLLPSLWQIIFSLGAFATARILPRPMFVVGVWYLICGLACLQFGQVVPLSGWSMGVPFGIGQLLVAGILYHHRREVA